MYKKVLSAAFALGVLAACAGPEANVQPSGDRTSGVLPINPATG